MLMLYLVTIIMGLIEGITEFIPISSTGHLILAGNWLGFDELVGGKDIADTFEIVIQLGAILAVVVAYPKRFAGLFKFGENRGFSGLRGLALLFITSVPAGLLGLAARKAIKAHLFNNVTVALGLAVGALWILAVEWYLRRRAAADQSGSPSRRKPIESVDSLTWRQSLGIGCFQCFALWPGMSRSSSTILGGMMVGVDRRAATEYSFFAAVPIMIAATFWEMYKSAGRLESQHLPVFAVGFVVAFISAWVAVKVFIHFLSRHTLVSFGWYRLAVAGLVLWWAFHTGTLLTQE
jgi:undecaprenyl-diphosphatase